MLAFIESFIKSANQIMNVLERIKLNSHSLTVYLRDVEEFTLLKINFRVNLNLHIK